ncbi:lectin-like domain-containing protein [Enterococcus faecium]|uniref:lectin-like domain-containing protein n=1 Tax=Enterococcus faecium TaxID=1352 RepID=UPI001D0E08BB|nr:hypothetical protein [Enterococcus faecium]
MNKYIHQFLQIFLSLSCLWLCFSISSRIVQAETVDEVVASAPDGISLENAFNLVPVGPNSHARIEKNANGNDVCVLTDDNRNQAAALWSTNNYKLDLTKDFDASMKIYLGNKVDKAADGITFTLQNDPKGNQAFSSCTDGGALGVYGSQNAETSENAAAEALQNSLSLEIDTHYNSGKNNAYDESLSIPGYGHVAVTLPGDNNTYKIQNGLLSHKVMIDHSYLCEPQILNAKALSNGQWHDLEVHYDASTNVLKYIFDAFTFSVPVDTSQFNSNEVYWGFTGTTGDDSTINAVVFSELPRPISVDASTDILKDGQSIVGKQVNIGDTLTYSLKVNYLDGIQNWTDIVPEETLNPYVEYIPNTLDIQYPGTSEDDKVEPTITQDHQLIVPQLPHDLGDNHGNQWQSAVITFDVKVNPIDSDQELVNVQDYTQFTGRNYTVKSYETDYSILNPPTPIIPNVGISFDEQTKNKEITIKNTSSYLTMLSGSWSGSKSDINYVLLINNKSYPISEGSFKEDGSFNIPVNLENIGKSGTNDVVIRLYDSTGQFAEDKANITLIKPNAAPLIKITNSSQVISVSPKNHQFTLTGQWKDKDSQTVSLFYKINGQEKTLAENISNSSKGTWIDFSKEIPLENLSTGENPVEVYAKDAEGQLSNVEHFVLELKAGAIKFKTIDPTISFQDSVISGKIMHSAPQATVGVAVEDTLEDKASWNLMVEQKLPFSDGEKNLAAQLSYQNNNEQLPITDHGQVMLPVVQENATDYALLQDSTHQFDLAIYTGNHIGNYQTELEWTLVTAP